MKKGAAFTAGVIWLLITLCWAVSFGADLYYKAQSWLLVLHGAALLLSVIMTVIRFGRYSRQKVLEQEAKAAAKAEKEETPPEAE